LGTYHSQQDRSHARRQGIPLYAPGGSKRRISGFLQVSRPTVDRWIRRCEAEHLAGLAAKSRAPKGPARQAGLPLMIDVYHRQKRHPDAGRFRMWSLLARPDISERTVGRVMALNQQVYDDIPHVDKPTSTPAPGPHPTKPRRPTSIGALTGGKWPLLSPGSSGGA
jgi:transposase